MCFGIFLFQEVHAVITESDGSYQADEFDIGASVVDIDPKLRTDNVVNTTPQNIIDSSSGMARPLGPSNAPVKKSPEDIKREELEKGLIPWERAQNPSQESEVCDVDKVNFSEDSRQVSSLGLKIRCGTVGLSDMPGQITYWIEYVLKIIPSLGVVMILLAGLFYLYGAVSDGYREKAKTALVSVAIGLVVAFTAWLLVDWVQTWLTAGRG